MAHFISKEEHRRIINKDKKDLTLAEIVFLQGLRIDELEKRAIYITKQIRENRRMVF